MSQAIKKAVADAIKRQCKELNMTLDYLARGCAIPHSTIQSYASGKTLPGAENIVLISRALKITCDQLLGEINW